MRRSQNSFVQIRVKAFEDAVAEHKLSLPEQGLLARLLLLVNHDTARYGCTLDELAQHLGMHRHNLRPKLTRLADCGLIECSFPQGHRGSVVVTSYLDLVRLSAPQVANHALRKERITPYVSSGFLPSETTETADPQVATRADTSSDSRGANRASPMSVSVDAPARGEVAAVVDIKEAREKRVASHPVTDATPGRASLPCASAHVCGCSAGGGSEATPVHPRSLRNDITPSLRQEAPLRDPRAMDAAW